MCGRASQVESPFRSAGSLERVGADTVDPVVGRVMVSQRVDQLGDMSVASPRWRLQPSPRRHSLARHHAEGWMALFCKLNAFDNLDCYSRPLTS